MHGHASAYAALGLEPGAGREEVERAYRRLIKLHHPDRDGGNSDRAAEINRAYAELRRDGGEPPPPVITPQPRQPARARRSARRARERRMRSQIWSVLTLGLSGLLLLQAEPLSEDLDVGWRLFERAVQPVIAGGRRQRSAAEPAIESSLSELAISAAVREASAMSAAGREEDLAEHSRACHRELRTKRSVLALDRCVAFDVAVAVLADRDPMRDGGRFGASELTARQMSSASLISNDYLAIERRLDRVRTAVELRLLPRAAPEPQPDPEPLPEPEPLPPLP